MHGSADAPQGRRAGRGGWRRVRVCVRGGGGGGGRATRATVCTPCARWPVCQGHLPWTPCPSRVGVPSPLMPPAQHARRPQTLRGPRSSSPVFCPSEQAQERVRRRERGRMRPPCRCRPYWFQGAPPHHQHPSAMERAGVQSWAAQPQRDARKREFGERIAGTGSCTTLAHTHTLPHPHLVVPLPVEPGPLLQDRGRPSPHGLSSRRCEWRGCPPPPPRRPLRGPWPWGRTCG